MCEGRTCNWYTREGWKEAEIGENFGFSSLMEYISAFMHEGLFGASSNECPCCGMPVEMDLPNCGTCGWEGVLIKEGLI